MNEFSRQKMLRIADGNMEVVKYLHVIYMHVRHDEILDWLLRHRLTGKEFLTWAKFHFGHFRLDLIKHVLKEIDRDVEAKAIIAGKDFITR